MSNHYNTSNIKLNERIRDIGECIKNERPTHTKTHYFDLNEANILISRKMRTTKKNECRLSLYKPEQLLDKTRREDSPKALALKYES